MDLSLIVLLSGFLFTYSVKVCVYSLNILYNIHCDVSDRAKEEENKNKIPESVKHLYS